jgi:glycosyltransferase involved in cell wall biosynthesis
MSAILANSADILVPSVRQGDATSNHTFALARWLMRRGYAVRICCDRPTPTALPTDIAPLVQQMDYAGYHPMAELTILQYSIWFPLAERFREAPGKAIFWYHGVTPPELWGSDEGQDRLLNAQARSELAWRAQLAVACSPYTVAELHRHSGYPLDRIRVVPIGVDLDAFRRPPQPETLAQLRRQWNLQDKRVLLCVGRIAGNKRLDLVVQALAHLRGDFPDLRLLIVGDTHLNPLARELVVQLTQQAGQLGIDDRVTFTGRVEQLAPYLHLADVYVLASQHEGFGVPLVEAMAAGAPIVASASAAIPWVLNSAAGEEGAAGLPFTSGDSHDLARQVARLLTDSELRRQLVARGQARCEEFSLAHFDEDVARVLDEAAHLERPDPAQREPAATPLLALADVVERDYRVRSRIPLIGRAVAWLRANSTTHVKEAYFDPIIEQQVNYNRRLARTIGVLQGRLDRLSEGISRVSGEQLQRKDAKDAEEQQE